MSAAGLIEMPPLSNVMPLPTSAQPRLARRTTSIAQDDQAWLVDTALTDAQQRAHPLLAHPVWPKDLALQPTCFRQLLGARGELHWRQHVGRLVAQVAGEVLRLGEDTPALDGGPQRRLASTPEDGDRLDLARVLVRLALAARVALLRIGSPSRLVAAELVEAEDCALGGGARRLRQIQPMLSPGQR